jgi:anti-sigma regulatory factor (Ser/Thr protein kinase)
MAKLYELCVSSQLTNLAQIAEFITQRAALAGLDEEQAYAVQTAVDEACTNAMEHAYEGRADGEVRICCYQEDCDFVVRITDFGKAFDPATVPVPDVSAPLEERTAGGLGLFLMRRLMDSVEFHFDPVQGNEVVMRKHGNGQR